MIEPAARGISPQFAQTRLEAAAFESEVLRELIRLHAGMLTRMPWVQALLVIGVGLLVFRTAPAWMLAGWGISTVAAECLRAVYAGRILQLGDNFNPKPVHVRLTLLAAEVAATVGLGAMLFIPRMPLPDKALLCIILFAMPAAGVSVAVSSRQILAAYSLLILVPTSFSWGMLYPSQTLTVVGLTVLYWGFIISVAADGEQLLRRSVAIRCERDRMVTDLERRNSEVRAAVAKAEQSSQARARVLAAASHDLRQPLHALSVYSAVLASNPAAETLPEVASNIDRLVRSLGGLLHGLLDLSRLSADYYVPERQRISLERLVGEVCNEYEANARDKRLRLIRELEHVRLCDDPVAIARITRNLLDNALKYTEQGEVRVATRLDGDIAVLTVEDTGKGIPADEQCRIFEEFYQLDNPGRDQGKGVGLGLAIVQRLCELIGAGIELSSEPGVGSRFSVTFHSIATDAMHRKAAAAAEAMRLQGKLIYVVDDEIDILEAMRALLLSWEVRVEIAQSPQAAEVLFNRSGKPHLLIVDLRLRGDEHGAALANRLQRLYGGFPVLVVTGETASEALQQTNAEGYPLLQKPIASEVLYDAACTAIGG